MPRKQKVNSLPDEADAALDDVVTKAVADVEYLLEVLMPDGRPFGVKPKPVEEQLQEYINGGFHDNQAACENYIRQLILQIHTMLSNFGVPPEQIATVMPYDIAETAALQWSAQMEKLLAEQAAVTYAP